ncbi:polysaccharide pyruvyl transferase family protein [Psychrobacter glaciei]|uniref:polysaccharide pyruvyl transferase family protein n=1 Tax=Psychrobacter glaciei TaxID=619771 RepID=UPI001F06C2ED|nr:polysaccharide pyruvyl transferase family protein [Psychrobacter glaciei]MCH1782992.1 polysaccharide pyruvyl transferase family protein [Psychrobacter glaciei]
MNNIIYLNYTAIDPHIGCIGVCYAHLTSLFSRNIVVETYSNSQIKQYWKGDRPSSIEYIQNSAIANRLYACDGIVINGEGTLHHNRGLFLLAIAEYAINIGKPVFLINATIQEIDGFDDVFGRFTDLAVREFASYDYLRRKGIECRLTVDSIVNADFSNDTNMDFNSKIVVNDWHPHVESVIYPIVSKVQADYDVLYYPLQNSKAYESWHHTVANYQTAELIIAPRYHSIYLSGLAGKPFVALPSNSHKVEGIIKSSGLPLPICSHPRDLEGFINQALKSRRLYEEFKEFLEESKNKDFEVFDNYYGLSLESSILKSTRVINQWHEKIANHHSISESNFYKDLLRKDMLLSKNSLAVKNDVIKNRLYTIYYKKYSTIFIKDSNLIFNSALAAYGVRDFVASEKLFQLLIDLNAKLAYKYLEYLYMDLDRYPEILDAASKNMDDWNQAKYIYLLHSHKMQEAWELLHFRPFSKNLIEKGSHYSLHLDTQKITVIMEGGIGDQVKQSLVFKPLSENFFEISIVCDARLIAPFKRVNPNFSYIDQNDFLNDHCVMVPAQDLFRYFRHDLEDIYLTLKVDKNLKEYWSTLFNSFGKSKIIGVCTGTEISTPERIANIFSAKNYNKIFEVYNDFLYVNIGIPKFNNINVYEPKIDKKNDIENVLSIIECCDFIITPPNSLLDICGGLGKNVIAISTGNKFIWRFDKDYHDIYHKNTKWVVTKTVDKKTITIHKCISIIETML